MNRWKDSPLPMSPYSPPPEVPSAVAVPSDAAFSVKRVVLMLLPLLAVLVAVVLGIYFLNPPPDPIVQDDGASAIPPAAIETVNGAQASDILANAIAAFNSGAAESGGVVAVLTSNLLAATPDELTTLQVAAPTQNGANADNVISTFDVDGLPLPVRSTQSGRTFVNTVTPFSANTEMVARIRDSGSTSEWHLGNPDDPTATLPTLPEMATSLMGVVEESGVEAVQATSNDITQLSATVPSLPTGVVPVTLMPPADEAVTVSFLLTPQQGLVGVRITSADVDATTRLVYSLPTNGFQPVTLPTVPAGDQTPPNELSIEGRWQESLSLAEKIQSEVRAATLVEYPNQVSTNYDAALTANILSSPEIAAGLQELNATFDPASGELSAASDIVVCVPFGIVAPSELGYGAFPPPGSYLDACPPLPFDELLSEIPTPAPSGSTASS